jgi:hypothetical protein
VDEKDTPREDTRLNLHDESGMTRRDLMRRGAVVGGTLIWVAPAIQSIGAKAYAQTTGSPLCDACLAVTIVRPNGSSVTRHLHITPSADCCACIDAFDPGGEDPLGAIVSCVASQGCSPSGGGGLVHQGPCD